MLCPPSTRAPSFLVPPSPLRLLAVFPLELIGRFPVFFFDFSPKHHRFQFAVHAAVSEPALLRVFDCFIFIQQLKMALTGFRPIYRFLSRL